MDGCSGGATSQLGMVPISSSVEGYIMHLFYVKVTPGLIHNYETRQAFFSRCSFYIEIMHKNLGSYTTPIQAHLINSATLQRVKQDAKTQVRVQLAYQIALLQTLRRCREDIAVIAEKIRLGYVVCEEDDVRSKISSLLDAVSEFESSLSLGPVYNRHKLISEATALPLPPIQLELTLRKPVIFKRAACVSCFKSVYLHWDIEDQEQHEPGEHFQIQYKIKDPENGNAGNQPVTLTTELYNTSISDLMPGKLYEFTIQRVNSCFLVYSMWADTIWLKVSADR